MIPTTTTTTTTQHNTTPLSLVAWLLCQVLFKRSAPLQSTIPSSAHQAHHPSPHRLRQTIHCICWIKRQRNTSARRPNASAVTLWSQICPLSHVISPLPEPQRSPYTFSCSESFSLVGSVTASQHRSERWHATSLVLAVHLFHFLIFSHRLFFIFADSYNLPCLPHPFAWHKPLYLSQ